MNHRYLFMALLSLLLSSFLTGRGISDEKTLHEDADKNLKPKQRTLTLNLQEGDPPTLHPHKGVDLRSRCLFLALYEPLMRRTAEGILECAAAERVEVDSSQTVYTFHIRSHQWSNGQRVTSMHFARSWKYALSPTSSCVRADLFYPIKYAEKIKRGELSLDVLGISTPDEKTLIVELEHPTPYFLDLTATSFFCPLYHPSAEEPTCFNGPFIVANWDHDQLLTFAQNPLYWDRTSVQLDNIRFTIVKDPTTTLAMYQQGHLDLVGDPFSSLPFEAIPSLAASKQLRTTNISRIFYLLLNTNVPPLHLASVRKALSLSIDREQLTKHLFFGEKPALSHLPEILSLLHPRQLPAQEKEAVKLFEAALAQLKIHRDQFPILVLSYANLSGQKSLAEFIQEQWRKKLGIKVDIVCSEWNVHSVQLRKKNYQIGTIHLTTLYQDPMFYFELFKNKADPCNYCGWEHPCFQRLLNKAATVRDAQVRSSCLLEAETLLMEEMPVIPIFTQTLQYLVRDPVKLVISDLGIYDFKKTTVVPP